MVVTSHPQRFSLLVLPGCRRFLPAKFNFFFPPPIRIFACSPYSRIVGFRVGWVGNPHNWCLTSSVFLLAKKISFPLPKRSFSELAYFSANSSKLKVNLFTSWLWKTLCFPFVKTATPFRPAAQLWATRCLGKTLVLEGGKGLFINSQARPLRASEGNQATRKGTSP